MSKEDRLGQEEAFVPYEVVYTTDVINFMIANIWSKRVYEKIDLYRHLLADYPDLGAPYNPEYPAARPPFPCRWLPVPDTPFTLYYFKDEEAHRIAVFYIEHQGIDPESHFEWGTVTL